MPSAFALPGGSEDAMLDILPGLAVAAFLFVYLCAALLRPDRF
ncbi:hypothetical protein MASR2M74_28690 [Paracoccaceae bacterium]